MEKTEYKRSRAVLVLLIISTAVFGILLIPGIWFSAFSVMMFDAPGSEKNVFLIILFSSIASFPVLTVLSFTSWIFYFLRKQKISVIIALSPLVSILLSIILFALSSIFFGGSLTP